MMQLPRYESYKDSGVEWLGEIPEEWDVQKAKFIWRERNERSVTGEEQLLSVSQYYGVKPNFEQARSESLVDYKTTKKDDLVINIMLTWLGGLGTSKYEGLVSPSYAVYRALIECSTTYLGYLYRTPSYLAEFARRSTGVVPSRWRMYTEDFGQVLTLLPPIETQERIVSFLDKKTAEIDEAIAKKQKLVELLQEQKSILINQAVTKGLNPDAPMKDSGVEWIGEIPAHWEVKKLKFVLKSMEYGTSESSKSEGAYKVLTMGHIQDGLVTHSEAGYLDSIDPNLILQKDDILFNRTNSFDLVGKSGIFKGDIKDNITYASYLVRLRVKDQVDPTWLNYILNAPKFLSFIRTLALRSLHQANLNPNRLCAVHIPVPKHPEQVIIGEHIETTSISVNETIQSVVASIDALKEYKSSLISSAVTGKIKV